MSNPILQCTADGVFSDWVLDPDTEEGQLMMEFVQSKHYIVLRKMLTYRASELTESLIRPLDTDKYEVIQGRTQEVLDLISELDDFGSVGPEEGSEELHSNDTIVE